MARGALDAALAALRLEISRADAPKFVAGNVPKAAAALAEAIAAERPEIYGLVSSASELSLVAADIVRLADPKSGEEFLEQFEIQANREWVVRVDLGHVASPTDPERLSATVVFAPTSGWTPSPPTPDSYDEFLRQQEGQRQIVAWLGAAPELGNRWDAHLDRDMRTASSLFVRRHGPERSARRRALASARSILAAWTVLREPADHDRLRVWPEVSEWRPHAVLHAAPATAPVDDWTDESRLSGSTQFEVEEAFYDPPDDRGRQAPALALERAADSEPAAALLAASYHLYRSAFAQQSLDLQDRLAHARSALDVLCEKPGGAADAPKARRDALLRNMRVQEQLAEWDWPLDRFDSFINDGQLARNIAVHSRSSVAAAIDGFSIPTRGGQLHDATQATYGHALAACRELWSAMIDSDFSEKRWEEHFRASG